MGLSKVLIVPFINHKLASHLLPDLVNDHTTKPKATTPTPPKIIINPSIIHLLITLYPKNASEAVVKSPINKSNQ